MTTAPAADVFTASSALTFVESMRLGLGVGIPIHP